MDKKNISYLFYIIIGLLIFNLGLGILGLRKSHLSFNDLQNYANELKNKKLYTQSIEAYKNFLSVNKFSKKFRANVNYIIAEIYNNDLNDYDNALAYYIKAKYFDPHSSYLSMINQKIIQCLEKSGRTIDAKNELGKATALDKSKTQDHDVVVAKIDDMPITLGQFQTWYEGLPEKLKKQNTGIEGKKKLLRNFVSEQLLYSSAQRRGYDHDKNILDQTFQYKKSLMVQKVFQDEVMKNTKIDKNDLQLYYQAHKKDFYDSLHHRQKTFEEVQQEVYRKMMQGKIQYASQDLINKLLTSSRVRIFDDLVK